MEPEEGGNMPAEGGDQEEPELQKEGGDLPEECCSGGDLPVEGSGGELSEGSGGVVLLSRPQMPPLPPPLG